MVEGWVLEFGGCFVMMQQSSRNSVQQGSFTNCYVSKSDSVDISVTSGFKTIQSWFSKLALSNRCLTTTTIDHCPMLSELVTGILYASHPFHNHRTWIFHMHCSIILLNLYKIWCNQSNRLVQYRGLPHAARGSCIETYNCNGCIPPPKNVGIEGPLLVSTPSQQANLLGVSSFPAINVDKRNESILPRASPPRKATKRSTISFFLPTGKPCSLHSCRSSWQRWHHGFIKKTFRCLTVNPKNAEANWMSFFGRVHQLAVQQNFNRKPREPLKEISKRYLNRLPETPVQSNLEP